MTKALTLAPLSWLPIAAEKTSRATIALVLRSLPTYQTPATIAAVAAANHSAKPRSAGSAASGRQMTPIKGG
jgi:hypothetical protein